MNRPTAVARLLEELEGEIIHSDVEVSKNSKVVIFLNEDDHEGFELNPKECRLLLANVDTVQRLIDAIAVPTNASLLLCEVGPNDDVLSLLERGFAAIDEG